MWDIKAEGFDSTQIIHFGNQFLTGHLQLGVRGTLEEYTKNELVAINLPLIYDQVGDGWREPVNAFNPLWTETYLNGKSLSVLKQKPIHHEQSLNLKDATMHRLTVFELDGVEVSIQSERFVSACSDRTILHKYQIKTSEDAKIEIHTGTDTDVWDINGPHLEQIDSYEDDYLYSTGKTHEKGIQIDTIKHIYADFDVEKEQVILSEHKIEKCFIFKSKKNQSYTLYAYSVIGVDETQDQLRQRLNEVAHEGYDDHLKKHQALWNEKWHEADVIIEGDPEAQKALRYSIYHLLLLAPHSYKDASIPARGISGQTYKGAIFWDTEIFMLPFYLNTDLESARQIINYRIQTLKGAKEKAKSYGFKGAFYAWESQEDGYDACTDYNVTDVFTGRKIRTYFKDKQVHISSDIVYAIASYIQRTNDFDILKAGALEVLLEVARFYLDYGVYKVLNHQFEICDVMGPDEYHERVNNNAFTNQMVQMVFNAVITYEKMFKEKQDVYFEDLVRELKFEEELSLLKDMKDQLFIQPVQSNGLIEQFDGYFKMHDVDKEELLSQRINPNEYLGGSGLAGDTQIIKQADVITMLYLFKDLYNKDIYRSNWNYYEPRTEHGSSLSASMYAIVACWIDQINYAYPLFMKSATIDLTGNSKQYAGGIYIGGTHPAASGGAYLTALYGFAGLSFKHGLKVTPKLPKSFKSMTFKIHHQAKTYLIHVTHQSSSIEEVK